MQRFLAHLMLTEVPRWQAESAPFSAHGCEVFCSGYIANRVELTAEAKHRGEYLQGSKTGELFALAYRWWGADLPRHVLGEYAVAVYDATQRTLLLTHDELGLLPLFYAQRQDRLVVGSHLEDVLGATGIGTLDEEYIIDYLAEGWHLGKHTPYTHIRRVLPGQSIVWKNGCLTEHATWTISAVQPLHYRDPRDYEEQLRQLLITAVTNAISPQDKVLCELSGGLDSSTVLAVAARSGVNNLAAFSYVYSESDTADERRWIDAVLDRYPVPWHSIDADKVRPFSEMPGVFCAEPNLALLNAARQRHYYQLLTAHNIDIVLTGLGGDATLIGDGPEPYYLADLLQGFRFGLLWHSIQSWSRASDQKRPPMYWLSRFVLRPWWRRLRHQLTEYEQTAIPWIAKPYTKRIELAQRIGSAQSPCFSSTAQTWFFERVLRSAHSVSMRYREAEIRCNFRHPLLYRPLVNYMCSVPWDVKLHPTCDRLLQRRALEGILPDRIIRRRSKLGPDQTFYSGLEASVEWYDLLTKNPRSVQLGYVLRDEWIHAIRQARLGRTIGIRFLLSSASLEVWLQQLERLSSYSRSLQADSKA